MTGGREWTHPDVLGRGILEGWADPCTDPTQIDWAARMRCAAVPFRVVDGRPVNPAGPTGTRYGRGELGHWGEAQAADAVVTVQRAGRRWLLLVERADGHGWALPGGHVDSGEDAVSAAVRELAEETGLVLPGGVRPVAGDARVVPDPRQTDEAWMVTTPVHMGLVLAPSESLPRVCGADDARQAAWLPADSYELLTRTVRIFPAHRDMLRELLSVS